MSLKLFLSYIKMMCCEVKSIGNSVACSVGSKVIFANPPRNPQGTIQWNLKSWRSGTRCANRQRRISVACSYMVSTLLVWVGNVVTE